jgi:hypothetical protein
MVATSVNNKWGDYDVDGPAPEGWSSKDADKSAS